MAPTPEILRRTEVLLIRRCFALVLLLGLAVILSESFATSVHAFEWPPPCHEAETLGNEAKAPPQEIIAAYTRCLEENLEPTAQAIAYNNRGNARYVAGEMEAAIADFYRSIALAPEHADTYLNRANIYFARGKYDRAIKDLDRTIAMDPENATAHFNRGNTYSAMEQWDQAIADYQTAIELAPAYGKVYLNLANAYAAQGDLQNALPMFTKVIEYQPFNGHLGRAHVLVRLGELDAALQDFSEAIRLDPASPQARHFRGKTRKEAGNMKGALEDFTEAIRLDPGAGINYFERGKLYYDLGQREKALADLLRAEELRAKAQ